MKRIPKVVRDYVYKRDRGRCRICQRKISLEEAHIHHIYHRNAYIPDKFGIPPTKHNNHPHNLILTCPECHGDLHSGKELPRYTREVLIKWNQEMEFIYPFPKELIKWLKDNEVRR